MLRNSPIGWIAGSAAMAGLVWAGRSLWGYLRPQPSAAPSTSNETNGERGWEGDAIDEAAARESERDSGAIARPGWEGEALDDAVRRDTLPAEAAEDLDEDDVRGALGDAGELRADFVARHDALRDLGVDEDTDFDIDTQSDPEDIDELDLGPTVAFTEHEAVQDEPFDALDAEDVGTEWLLRATQTTIQEGPNAAEFLDGMHTVDDPNLDEGEDPRESEYGSDQEGAPLAPYAGTHDEDVAAELPVGTMDATGNAELHTPANPPDAFGAPPTGELALTEEELTARRSASARAKPR